MSEDLRKLAADLHAAGPRIGMLAATAIRKGAFDIIAHAQQRVPVDTGATKNSIGADFEGDGRSGSMSAVVGPTTSYAPYLEFGTRRMAPRPFMAPAADAVLPGVEEAVAQIGGSIL